MREHGAGKLVLAEEAGVADGARMRLGATLLDAPDARELAGFYRRLLGWEVAEDEPGWVTLRVPGDGAVAEPQDDVRVFLDPAGHPFCLFLP